MHRLVIKFREMLGLSGKRGMFYLEIRMKTLKAWHFLYYKARLVDNLKYFPTGSQKSKIFT